MSSFAKTFPGAIKGKASPQGVYLRLTCRKHLLNTLGLFEGNAVGTEIPSAIHQVDCGLCRFSNIYNSHQWPRQWGVSRGQRSQTGGPTVTTIICHMYGIPLKTTA